MNLFVCFFPCKYVKRVIVQRLSHPARQQSHQRGFIENSCTSGERLHGSCLYRASPSSYAVAGIYSHTAGDGDAHAVSSARRRRPQPVRMWATLRWRPPCHAAGGAGGAHTGRRAVRHAVWAVVRSQLIGHETTDVYGVFLQAKPDEAFFCPTETIGAAFFCDITCFSLACRNEWPTTGSQREIWGRANAEPPHKRKATSVLRIVINQSRDPSNAH